MREKVKKIRREVGLIRPDHAPNIVGYDTFIIDGIGRRIRSCRGRQGRCLLSMQNAECAMHSQDIGGHV